MPLSSLRPALPRLRWHAESLAAGARRHSGLLGPRAAASLCFADALARVRGPAARGGTDRRTLWPAWLPGYRFPVFHRAGSMDVNVIEQVLGGREYECVSREPDVETILDLGGNVGLATFYLLHHYPKARAVVVEPDAGNLRVARRTLAPFAPRVAFVRAGVWDAPCDLVVERGNYRDGGEWAYQVRAGRPGEAPDVRGVTVAGLLDAHGFARVDLLKMDIEAAERVVFAPAARPEAWLGRVGTLAVELHGPACAAAVHAAAEPFRPRIEQSGELTVFRFPPAGGPAWT